MAVQYGLYLGMNAEPIQSIREASASAKYPLGAFFDDEFGRRFRYAVDGGSGLTAGNIVQNAALGGAATTLQSAAAVSVASSADDTRIYVTAVTTAQAADLYNEGWAAVNDVTAGTIYTRRIKDHTSLATSGTASYLDLYEGIPVALTTSDKVALQINLYKNIVVMPTTATGIALGGVHCDVTASYYTWVQTRGIFGFKLKDVTTNIGVGPATYAGTTAGSLIINAEQDSTAALRQTIGDSTALWLDEYGGFVVLRCE